MQPGFLQPARKCVAVLNDYARLLDVVLKREFDQHTQQDCDRVRVFVQVQMELELFINLMMALEPARPNEADILLWNERVRTVGVAFALGFTFAGLAEGFDPPGVAGFAGSPSSDHATCSGICPSVRRCVGGKGSHRCARDPSQPDR